MRRVHAGMEKTGPQRALGVLIAGTSGAEVGRHFGVHRSTKKSTSPKKISTDRFDSRQPRNCAAAEPRVTTPADDRHYIKTMRLRDCSRVTCVAAAETVGRNRPQSSFIDS